jgi:hypothetical protein
MGCHADGQQDRKREQRVLAQGTQRCLKVRHSRRA